MLLCLCQLIIGIPMPYKDPAKKKEKQKEYARKYYETNKDKIIAASGKARKSKRAEFAAFKSRLSCTKCGENHPATLDFHHVVPNPANKKITELLKNPAVPVPATVVMMPFVAILRMR